MARRKGWYVPPPKGRKKTKAERQAEWERIKADAIARGGVLCTLRIEMRVKARTPAEKAMAERLFIEQAHKEWTEETGRTSSRWTTGERPENL